MACGRRDLWVVGGPGGKITDAWRTASALIAVGQPLVFPRSRAVGAHRWLFHGRPRTTSFGRSEDTANLLVEQVVVAVDAVGIDGEQDRDAC